MKLDIFPKAQNRILYFEVGLKGRVGELEAERVSAEMQQGMKETGKVWLYLEVYTCVPNPDGGGAGTGRDESRHG